MAELERVRIERAVHPGSFALPVTHVVMGGPQARSFGVMIPLEQLDLRELEAIETELLELERQFAGDAAALREQLVRRMEAIHDSAAHRAEQLEAWRAKVAL